MNDEYYMRECLRLARLGQGNVAPNPMVGCVVVCDGQIVGSGWHQKYGEAHAEVNAIESVADKSMLSRSTLYVNLEPCSHWGKTPPCADLIIGCGIPRVVIGMLDPFPKVYMQGVSRMCAAGIDIKFGVLEEECAELNKHFVTYHTKHRPYIVLKWAQTSDGYLDNNRTADTPPTWMTGDEGRLAVHCRRAEMAAIMVGTNTVERDDPSLTVRMCKGKNPLRVVIDRNLRLSPRYKVFDNEAPTVVFTLAENLAHARRIYEGFRVEAAETLKELILSLYDMKINSLYIEGGATILNEFIRIGLWDEINIFVSPLKVADLAGGRDIEPKGVKAPAITGYVLSQETIGNNVKYIVTRNKQAPEF